MSSKPTLVLLLLAGMPGALAAGFSCALSRADDEKSRGTELVYENADVHFYADKPMNLEGVVPILNRRFTGRLAKIAHAELRSPQRIRVRVAGTDADMIREIERRTETIGTIEFRILANHHDHGPIIQQAEQGHSRGVPDRNRRLIAEWFPVSKAMDGSVDGDHTVVSRTVRIHDSVVREVLVVNDDFRLDGSYLAFAEAGVDSLSKPCLKLHWNDAGKKLLSGLTGDNLPDRERGTVRSLGIILDKRLHAACPIRTKLSDTMIITGDFRHEDLDGLIAVLNSGSLPVRLKQAAKRPASQVEQD